MSKPYNRGGFFCCDAKYLAVHKDRPWQVCSDIGALCGYLPTEDHARAAVDALAADKEAGNLPCDLSTWDKRPLLEIVTRTD